MVSLWCRQDPSLAAEITDEMQQYEQFPLGCLLPHVHDVVTLDSFGKKRQTILPKPAMKCK
jgi:hypothetical protein